MSLVRSAGLQGFRRTVRELGGDPVLFARQAGLAVEALDTPEWIVEDTAIAAVLEIAAAALGQSDLGLRVASAPEPSLLGPLAVVLQNSASVKDAIECMSRYMYVHA